MKLYHKNTLRNHLCCGLAIASGLLCSQSLNAAEEILGVQVGGFLSQGYLISTDNDYLADSSKGSFDFREYGVNASKTFGANWRIGAQVFGQKLGKYGNDKVTVDWAIVDYNFNQQFGIRAGRVKIPRGLYNESLDLEVTRPFVLLPQTFYDARLRDFNNAFNGGMFYGTFDLKSMGSLDYKAYFGDIQIRTTDSGVNDFFSAGNTAYSYDLGMDYTYGGQLFWSTPLSGLRIGLSLSDFHNLYGSQLAPPPLTGIASVLIEINDYTRYVFSAEYFYEDWMFALEAGKEVAFAGVSVVNMPGPGPSTMPFGSVNISNRQLSLAVSRRINSWLEVGAYAGAIEGVAPSPSAIKYGADHCYDYALSFRFDITSHLIFKIEGHYVDGTSMLFNLPDWPQPDFAREPEWFYFASKLTFHF
ncbi:MAG: hypothetical protein SFY80_17340 [Verrucomicrobiota bacterium]|nr:hypothetical protein [Verrucomicrobiota bacterium]